jgi:hypothetical protein
MAEAVFVDQEEADLNAQRAAQLSAGYICAAAAGALRYPASWWQTQISRSEEQLWPTEEVLPIE